MIRVFSLPGAATGGKGVHRNFSKITRKHLCQSLFFNKLAGLRPKDGVKDLGCRPWSKDGVDLAIEKYKDHPSIKG